MHHAILRRKLQKIGKLGRQKNRKSGTGIEPLDTKATRGYLQPDGVFRDKVKTTGLLDRRDRTLNLIHISSLVGDNENADSWRNGHDRPLTDYLHMCKYAKNKVEMPFLF